MAGSVDLRLLRTTAHSPSYFALTRESGGRRELIDFCIPCNPYFPTPEVFDRLRENLEGILKYYPSDAETITAELCSTLGLNPQTVAMGNGSTELITWIDHLLVRESLAIPIPTFGRWTDQPLETGKRVDMFQLYEEHDFRLDVDAYVRFIRDRGSRVAVICNPNNPDGGYLPRQEVVRLLDLLCDLDLVIVDESFIDFVDAEPYRSVAEEAAIRPNVIVLKSLGKNFGLHGVRFGYLVANPGLAGRVRAALPKWNLNSFAEVVVFLLKDHQEAYHQSLRLLARDRQVMFGQLSQLPGLTVLPSQGNFLLIKLPEGRDGVELRDYLMAEFGVYVRECGNKLGSNSRFLRLVVRPQPDVQVLLNGLFAFLYGVETLTPPQPGTTAESDPRWAAAIADVAASRPVTVADILAARPDGTPAHETRSYYPADPATPPQHAPQRAIAPGPATGPFPAMGPDPGARRTGPDTGTFHAAAPSTGSFAAGPNTGSFPGAVPDPGSSHRVGPDTGSFQPAGPNTGSFQAVSPEPGFSRVSTDTGASQAVGPHTGAFQAVGPEPGFSRAGTDTGSFQAVGPHTGSFERVGPATGSFERVGPGTGPFQAVGPEAGSPHAGGPGTGPHPAVGGMGPGRQDGPGPDGGQDERGRPAGGGSRSAHDTGQWSTGARQAGAGRGTGNSGEWPAVSPADLAAARPKPLDTGQWPAVQAGNDTGTRWPGVSDSAPRQDPRAGRPTVAGGGRPTVADVNSRSGYGGLGQDDGFLIAPKHARDQSGPGTDWITVQRRGRS